MALSTIKKGVSMKPFAVILSLTLLIGSLSADQQATATDGKTVLLHDNGTWEYLSVPQSPVSPTPMPIGNTGATIAVMGIRDGVQGSLFIQPDEGNKFFAVNVLVDNSKGSADLSGVNAFSSPFILKDSEGYTYSINVMVYKLLKPSFPASIAAGEKSRGWITYEVIQSVTPKDLRLQYKDDENTSAWIGLAGLTDSAGGK